MGCVGIWPVTVLKRSSRREVAMLALLVEDSLNPCKKAQEEEDLVVVQYNSVG